MRYSLVAFVIIYSRDIFLALIMHMYGEGIYNVSLAYRVVFHVLIICAVLSDGANSLL